MARFRYPREDELLAAASSALSSVDTTGASCPDRDQWTRVLSGAYAKDPATSERLLEHLSTCEACTDTLGRIRARRQRQRQRVTVVLAVLAAGILLAFGILWWFAPRQGSETVLVDLRDAAATRGAEAKTAPPVAIVAGSTGSIRIVLPVGSGSGRYQVGLFEPGDPPREVQVVSVNATTAESRLEIRFRFPPKRLAPGRYLLGLRSENSPWDFYPIKIQ